MGAGMALMIAILYGSIFPGLQLVRLSERLVDHMSAAGACGPNVMVGVIGYEEPSLDFYQGGGARTLLETYLVKTPQAAWPRWFVIRQDEWDRSVPPDLQAKLILIAREWGLDYSEGGKRTTVLFLQNPLAQK
jgi:hypothetical protein